MGHEQVWASIFCAQSSSGGDFAKSMPKMLTWRLVVSSPLVMVVMKPSIPCVNYRGAARGRIMNIAACCHAHLPRASHP